MKSREKRQTPNPNKILEVFLSLERWKKVDMKVDRKERLDVEQVRDRHFIIEKYKAKFPGVVPFDAETRDVIRL